MSSLSLSSLFTLILFIFPLLTPVCCVPTDIYLGAALPLSGPLESCGRRTWLLLNASLSDLSINLPGIQQEVNIHLLVEDSLGTQIGTFDAVYALASRGVIAILGGAESMNLISDRDTTFVADNTTGVGVGPGSAETSILNWAASSLTPPIPVIALSGSACTTRALSDRDTYPALLRLCIRQTSKARAMLALFSAMNWKQMAIIAQDTLDGWGNSETSSKDPVGNLLASGQSEADFIVSELYAMDNAQSSSSSSANILRMRISPQPALIETEIITQLKTLKESGFRVIVVYLTGVSLELLLKHAYALDMLRPPYVWIGAGSNSGPSSSLGTGTGSVSSGGAGPGLCSQFALDVVKDFTPFIPSLSASSGKSITSYSISSTGDSTNAASYVYQAELASTSSALLGTLCVTPAIPKSTAVTNLKYKLLTNQKIPFKSILNSADLSTYDIVPLFALTVRDLLRASLPLNQTNIFDGIIAHPYQGLGGLIKFTSTGDRLGFIDVLNYDSKGNLRGNFVRKGSYSELLDPNGVLDITEPIVWSDGTYNIPPDHVDKFKNGEILSISFDSRIVAVSYFFVCLPAIVFIYNIRHFIVTYVSSEGKQKNKANTFLYRGLTIMSFGCVFSMMYLNLLAMFLPVGDVLVHKAGFIMGLFFIFLLSMALLFQPILYELRKHLEKDVVEQQKQITKLSMVKKHHGDDDPVEAESTHISAFEEFEVPNEDDGKEEQDAAAKAKAKQAEKDKIRKAKQRNRKGKLTVDDKAGFISRETSYIIQKTSPGFLLTSAIFTLLIVGLFHLTIASLRLQMSVETDVGIAFAAAIVTWLCLHACLIYICKDARKVTRVLCGFFFAVILLMSFYFSFKSITFKYKPMNEYQVSDLSKDAFGVSEIAIAHAIFFAIPFFVGLLQVIKALKLSRHSLDSILGTMKSNLTALEEELESAKAQRKQAYADADHLKRLLELMNLCRPLHRNHALAFTMAENSLPNAAVGSAEKQAFIPASFTAAAGGKQPVSSGMTSSPLKKAGSGLNTPNQSQGIQNSQGITTANISGLDFSYLARGKSELTGYKLLNELSLELMLNSGPVVQRAVQDIQLTNILSHPITIELFKDSLTRPASQEALAFWLDIQRYKQLVSLETRRVIAEAMCSMYIYSDAQHAVPIAPANREQIINVMFSKRPCKANLFSNIELELQISLNRDLTNFSSTTGFKICAFLLGHSSYRPSTRIKTLTTGQAVGTGGQVIPLTQVHGGITSENDNQSLSNPNPTLKHINTELSLGGRSMNSAANAAHSHLYPGETGTPKVSAGVTGSTHSPLHANAVTGPNSTLQRKPTGAVVSPTPKKSLEVSSPPSAHKHSTSEDASSAAGSNAAPSRVVWHVPAANNAPAFQDASTFSKQADQPASGRKAAQHNVEKLLSNDDEKEAKSP